MVQMHTYTGSQFKSYKLTLLSLGSAELMKWTKDRIPCAARIFHKGLVRKHLSCLMGKPTICIGENKDADQLRGNREADHAFVFATRIEHFLFYLNLKFQASSLLLSLDSSVCVGPVRKPHCWFSHEAAHFMAILLML